MYYLKTKKTGVAKGLYRKILLIMRLTTVILIACLMQVSAAGLAQRITLSKNKAQLKNILKEIRKQSGYNFIYTDLLLTKATPVTINVKNTELDVVLKQIFENQPLAYEVNNKTVAIKDKEQPGFVEGIQFQPIDVHGRIVDKEGNGIVGATVSVKEVNKSVITGTNGFFTLKSVEENSTVAISFIGYVTKEFKAVENLGDLILEISDNPLDEVQVMAYGTTSRRLSTGNISTLKAADIEKQPVNNPIYALQGRIPGLQVTPTTGLAGGAVNLQIRGHNSRSYNSEPLIVIDGLPLVNNIEGLGHEGLRQFSTLSFINPNDIESIDILKDADATSIYGSRGSNGVIIITTKKGRTGQSKVEIDVKSGISDVAKHMDLLTTPTYLEMRREAFKNDNRNPNVINSPDLLAWDQGRNTDWQNELIGRNARYIDFQGNISGGTPDLQYIFGGLYHKETTVFAGDNSDQKGSAHLRLNSMSANKKLNMSLSVMYMTNKNTLPRIDFTNTALTLPPNAPALYNPDGTLNWELLPTGASSFVENPYEALYSVYEADVKNLISNSSITYEILPSIILKSQMGYNELKGSSFRNGSPLASLPPEYISPDLRFGSIFHSTEVKNFSLEPQITFNKRLGKFSVQALMGGAFQSSLENSQHLNADGFTSESLIKNLSLAEEVRAVNTSSEYKYAAVFGRLKLDWDSKYLLSLTIRRDGSSRFGPGKQFGNFGSVAAGWVFSEENVVKELLPLLSYGKVRASYGSSGNDGIPDYAYLERYQGTNVLSPYQGVQGYISQGIFNSYFHWENVRKNEFGLELGFFKDRIVLNGSIFRNRSDNQLGSYPFPSMVGPGVITYNLPLTIENKGLEFVLNSENIKNEKFRWSTSINFTRLRNKLLSVAEQIANPDYQIGEPFSGVSRLYRGAGVNPSTGLYQYENIERDIVSNPITSLSPNFGADVLLMTAPDFTSGISNMFTFGGFNLDIFLQVTKQRGESHMLSFYRRAGNRTNLPIEFINRWQKPGDISNVQKLTASVNSTTAINGDRYSKSDEAYVDASFLRVKNLSLSYNLPKIWVEKIRFQGLKIFVLGQNLWTLTKYKGLDPEMQSTSLPQLRVVTAGLRITL